MITNHTLRPEGGHQDQSGKHAREGHLHVGRGDDERVDPPADVACNQPEGRSERGGDKDRHHAHQQGDSGTVDQPGQDVAPELIGA